MGTIKKLISSVKSDQLETQKSNIFLKEEEATGRRGGEGGVRISVERFSHFAENS